MASFSPLASRAFPAELVDSVIDYNHSDPNTLMVCALVSKQWTPSSRYHLFSRVAIAHDNARGFAQLLSSPYCTISSVIRGLDIHFVSGSQRWFTEFSRRLSLLNNTNITSLGISGPGNTLIRHEAQSALSAFSDRVTDLDVGPVVFEAFADFARLLCTFQVLESLSCASTYQTGDQAEDLQLIAPLRQVQLVSPSTKLVFEFLLLQDVLPTITSLSLSYLAVEDYPNLTQYLKTPNDNLQSLTIKMDSSFSGATLNAFMDTLKLTDLRVLSELHLETDPPISPEQVFHLLDGIVSTQFKNLDMSAALVQGIARVDILLSSDKFSSLQRVKIIGSSWDDVRQFLSRCSFKNILREI
ncbi:hypothetical protein GALMADRAFT_144891 [Galerina marginata CBS 339.88]|uniref:F-box domain-containing protein n=1 Tax=Galerina marginata (strain CBS 339.88) TaxID=685588 RepID=A0A067SH32_GALM3|nr:hypothetical protein GALMADRAFT_144891 [Galerina marginata CBS 339.88]